VAIGREGAPDPDAPRDTIEVFALFTDPGGFFGLTSYLSYAREELRRVNEWARLARERHGAPHEFPWRHIDDSNVEAEGFLKEPFGFTIDEGRILNLLTGHTLYNDTSGNP
jgi:hypothetical protein